MTDQCLRRHIAALKARVRAIDRATRKRKKEANKMNTMRTIDNLIEIVHREATQAIRTTTLLGLLGKNYHDAQAAGPEAFGLWEQDYIARRADMVAAAQGNNGMSFSQQESLAGFNGLWATYEAQHPNSLMQDVTVGQFAAWVSKLGSGVLGSGALRSRATTSGGGTGGGTKEPAGG
jgi:1,6-anhydro-N-acetylmuramate kinase